MLAALFQVALSLSLIFLLLYGVTWFEQRVLSPQNLIVYSARSRTAQPEHVEVLVAAESKRLLADLAVPDRPVPDRPVPDRPVPDRPVPDRAVPDLLSGI